MSEDGGARPAPLVLDASILSAAARGDYGVLTFLQRLDARGQPFVIPALAVTAAALSTRTADAEDILHGLERLESAIAAPLSGAEQATRLAGIIARTGLESWDAHVASVADVSVCPILTLDAALWRAHANDLDEPLHFIEIADPDSSPVLRAPGPGRARQGNGVIVPHA